jgi:hypothetical protein
MTRSLTLLQRGVIQRLREAGFAALGEMAYTQWSRGDPIPGLGALPWDAMPKYRELAADLISANAQATTTT